VNVKRCKNVKIYSVHINAQRCNANDMDIKIKKDFDAVKDVDG
jgi:hypothetical protein